MCCLKIYGKLIILKRYYIKLYEIINTFMKDTLKTFLLYDKFSNLFCPLSFTYSHLTWARASHLASHFCFFKCHLPKKYLWDVYEMYTWDILFSVRWRIPIFLHTYIHPRFQKYIYFCFTLSLILYDLYVYIPIKLEISGLKTKVQKKKTN